MELEHLYNGFGLSIIQIWETNGKKYGLQLHVCNAMQTSVKIYGLVSRDRVDQLSSCLEILFTTVVVAD